MKSRREILEEVYNLAFKYEAELGSCPQCVFAAIMETLDFGDPNTFKAADALAGGTALSTEGTCGALVGGLLAISSIGGREYDDFNSGKRKRKVFKYAKKLYDKFVDAYGSPLCKDVHKKIFGRTFHLLKLKEYAEFEKAGAHIDKCPVVCGKTARWTAEIILDELKNWRRTK